MAENELELIRLRNDFYRDGFKKITFALFTITGAVALAIIVSFYLLTSHPAPVNFAVGNDWRLLPDVPTDRPYLKEADLVQWVSRVVQNLFTYDFADYTDELNSQQQYFTANGWKLYNTQLNTYANASDIAAGKLFVTGSPAGAPIIFNQGLVSDVYTWEIHMPINIRYDSLTGHNTVPLVLQIWVVRTSTLNDLAGVKIDNIVITKGQGDQIIATGKSAS